MFCPENYVGEPAEEEKNVQRRLTAILNKELRNIEKSKLTKLSSILDCAESWRQLLEALSRHKQNTQSGNGKGKFYLPLNAIHLIENQLQCGQSCSMALLNHWAITGRRRPTVGVLLNYLHFCELKWAEDYICKSVLEVESIDKLSSLLHLSSAKVVERTSSKPAISSIYDIDEDFKLEGLTTLVKSLETNCPKYSFQSIYESTNGFCHQPYDTESQTGTKIGEGRFSSVFLAKSAQLESTQKHQVVAAKLLKAECNKEYLVNEINLMVKIKHCNILELLGVALGKSNEANPMYMCLVYPYAQNGSLLDCISLGIPLRNREHLTWINRLKIGFKVAQGVTFLHKFHEGPIIHRDIKSANILIDIDLEPKIGDFTLVRHLSGNNWQETQYSQNVTGTSVYMPPEAFRGDVSTRFDTFSFGVVLLELITGMKPFDAVIGEDILTHIKDKLSDIDDLFVETRKIGNESSLSLLEEREGEINKFLMEVLDKKAGVWPLDKARALFDIAISATHEVKRNRPELVCILPALEDIFVSCSD